MSPIVTQMNYRVWSYTGQECSKFTIVNEGISLILVKQTLYSSAPSILYNNDVYPTSSIVWSTTFLLLNLNHIRLYKTLSYHSYTLCFFSKALMCLCASYPCCRLYPTLLNNKKNLQGPCYKNKNIYICFTIS